MTTNALGIELSSSNLASSIVERDGSGNFSANIITADLKGNADTATFATTAGSSPPSGSASGDLSGTYPSPTVTKINGASLGSSTASSGNVLIGSGTAWVTNPISGDLTLSSSGIVTLATVNTNTGSWGSATQVPVFTVNGKGLITAVTNTTISGTSPGGSAGGDLSGTYPNPTVAKINGVILGTTTATSGNLLIGSGTAWVTNAMSGDITINSTGVTAIGALKVTNAMIANSTIDLTAKVTGVLPNANGGTNQSTYATGDTLYASATNTLSKLTGNITTAKQYLSQTGTGSASQAPAWATIAGADITGAALTKADDTNVTLTLGGTPSTSLLRAASITAGWTGTLSGTRGGTGVNNGSSTITIGGNVTYSGAFTFTGTLTGTTSVTFPTSGTLATTAGTVSSITGTANQVLANGTSGSAQTGAVTLTLPQNIATTSSPTFGGLSVSSTGSVLPTITSTTTGSLNEGGLYLVRGDQTNGYAQIHYKNSSTDTWATGLRANSATYHIFDVVNNTDILSIAGGTGTTSVLTMAGSINAANFTISNTGAVQPIIQSTTTGSTNNADIWLKRGDVTNGFCRMILNDASTLRWSAGMRSGASTYLLFDETNSVTKYTATAGAAGAGSHSFDGSMAISANGSTTNAGQMLGINGANVSSGSLYGIGIQKAGTDILYLGVNKNTTTGSVPANACYISGFGAGSIIAIGRGSGTGTLNTADILLNSDGTVTFASSITATGVNVSGLTASTLVATDGSKNLSSSTTGLTPSFAGLTIASLAAYMCRAWVNFNGTGTIAIRASANVTSLTDTNVGRWVVNLTNAMTDANFSVGLSTQDNTNRVVCIDGGNTSATVLTTSTIPVACVGSSSTYTDNSVICVQIFR